MKPFMIVDTGGRLKLVDANDNVRTLSREEMWALAQKYIHRTAVVV